jgi:GNAT superfamily N-acetyltransferase
VHPDLAAALAGDRGLRLRAAAEAIPVPEGLVVRHPGLPDVHYLNAVVLDAAPGSGPDVAGVLGLAERWLGDRGPRHLVFDDAPAGERVAAALMDRGWARERTVFMAFAGDPARLARDDRAREISEPQRRELALVALAEDLAQDISAAGSRSGLAHQLTQAEQLLRGATPARAFGAGDGDGLHSVCTLYLCPDRDGRRVAIVDAVGTLAAHRERGLARAVVSAAVAAAGTAGADLIVVPADADDWPQMMYARLGFAPVGMQVSLTLRRPPPSGSGSGAV